MSLLFRFLPALILTGTAFAASPKVASDQPIVNFRFNIRGAQRFGQITTENLGRPLAIVLDNKVISSPVIQSPITGGSGQISGSFTVQQVNNLAR